MTAPETIDKVVIRQSNSCNTANCEECVDCSCQPCGGNPDKTCCNGACYDTRTQECCGGEVHDKGNCMACFYGTFWWTTCYTDLCQTCINNECKVCGDDPKKCCNNGECKQCCNRSTTGNCEGHNSDCGCDPIGWADCTGAIKDWTIGQTNFCWSECGGTTCYKDIVNVNCWSWQACDEGYFNYDSICINPPHVCAWTLYGICQDCISSGPAHVEPEMDCQCP